MIYLDYRDVMEEKFARQKQINEIESHVHSHCVHIGEISSGCRACFTGEDHIGVQVGDKCNFNCTYCYYQRPRHETQIHTINNNLSNFYNGMLDPAWNPIVISYQSTGETLYYIDEIKKFAELANKMNDKVNSYNYIYTNGTLVDANILKKLKKMNVHEIRFHLGASYFSEQVYENMKMAKNEGFIVTVETPSYPLHRNKIMEMLPRIEKIGVTHLNMIEMQVTEANKNKLINEYPGIKMYKDFYIHVYDEGLVYDVMEEVLDKDYSYSVLDCNSAVERCRQAKTDEVYFDMKSIQGMCRPHTYYKK